VVEGRPQCALVRRDGFAVRCDPIGPLELSLMEDLKSGSPLGEATEKLADRIGEDAAAPEVGAWFGRWIALGMIAKCELGGTRA
jgi:hypothetical protein